MDKEKFFSIGDTSPTALNYPAPSNWHSSSGMEMQVGDMNCSSEQLPNFLTLNWENSMDQSVPFESAMSSIVSSPAGSNSGVPPESVVIRELIGRLGSICNSGEISPTLGGSGASYIGGNNSTNTSCYSTPLNSPPKLNLSMMDHYHQTRGNLPVSGNSMATHHPNLAPFSADPGFAERAAKFSCFGNRNYGGLNAQFGFTGAEMPYRSAPRMESGKLSRVSSSQSLKAGSQTGVFENKEMALQDGLETEMRSVTDRKFNRLSRSSTPDDAELVTAREEFSAVTDQIGGGDFSLKSTNEANARKRKVVPKGKAKDTSSPFAIDSKGSEEDDSPAKRSRSAEANGNEKDVTKPKVDQNGSTSDGGQKQTTDNPKHPEPPKQDYIHVRARRGQATDSHSLAERVRREKISERMKFLQDLVPGCNKVTGKAVMLDEIINYVQSLQRQVEFLSMKLATVNPRLDFNMESLLSKDILQPRGSLPHTIYPLESSASAFSYGHQPQQGPLQSIVSNGSDINGSVNPLDATLRRTLSMQLPPIDCFGDVVSQIANFWEDDLQSVVQMGLGQNGETTFSSQSFHGSLPTPHMKIEL